MYKLKTILNSLKSLLYASFPSANSSKYCISITRVCVAGLTTFIKSCTVAQVMPLVVRVKEDKAAKVVRTAIASS